MTRLHTMERECAYVRGYVCVSKALWSQTAHQYLVCLEHMNQKEENSQLVRVWSYTVDQWVNCLVQGQNDRFCFNLVSSGIQSSNLSVTGPTL